MLTFALLELPTLIAADFPQQAVPASGTIPGAVATSAAVQTAPAEIDGRPAAERWMRRNQQLRESALGPMPRQIAHSVPRPLSSGAAPPSETVRPSPVQSFAMPPTNDQRLREARRQLALPDHQTAQPPDLLKRPSQLPKVTNILPYFDYEPDPTVAKEDPCLNLCPRPDGAPCKPLAGRAPECPKEISLAEGPYQPRAFAPSLYAWQASNIYYNPLYFEDAPLERYGHTYPCYIQPIVSSAKFTAQAALLPYQMTIDPICKRVYPLGYYRPGECAPKKTYQIPWNWHAAMVQAGVVTGVVFLFP